MILVVVVSSCYAVWHCADGHGRIQALAADGNFIVRPAVDASPNGNNPEAWVRINEDNPPSGGKVANSFTGSYMQVLPDDRDSYNHVTGSSSFTMTGLQFNIRIYDPGMHTLFLRWTGGDAVGGGDSLYVVMYDVQDRIVAGVPTYSAKTVGMVEKEGQFAGCCYNPDTHACPCYEPAQLPQTGDSFPGCQSWISSSSPRARTLGLMCEVGHGQVKWVSAPMWYLFAGQAYGNVMDFDSEPWDATCEAEGTGTKDSGLDVAQWKLESGDYRLVIYPREDGVAVDSLYLATPKNPQPPNDLRLKAGDSTISFCSDVPTQEKDSFMQQRSNGGDFWETILMLIVIGQLTACSCILAYERLKGRKLVSRSPTGNAAALTLVSPAQSASHYVPPP